MTKTEQMRRIRKSGTGIECRLRTLLRESGVFYRVNVKALPGKPDLYIPRLRLVVFANGCFWHGHTCHKGQTLPKTNRLFWEAKIAGNIARDEFVRGRLSALGYSALTFWECTANSLPAFVHYIAQIYHDLPKQDLQRSLQ